MEMAEKRKLFRYAAALPAAVLLALPACATVEGRPFSAGGRPGGASSGVKILKTGVHVFDAGDRIAIEHRGVYMVSFDGDAEEVVVTHRLKDDSRRTLSERTTRRTQRPGIYPVTLAAQVPPGLPRNERFMLEFAVQTPFGSATSDRMFALTPTAFPRPTEREKIMEIHNYLKSGTMKCPPGRRPVVREVSNGSGSVAEISLECLSRGSLKGAREETGINYPKTGRFYPIDRSKHPEFYRKCDLDGDGNLSMEEMARVQRTLSGITKRHPEGAVDAIVREFVSAPILQTEEGR
jgi:hypothetical protein